MVTQLFKRQPHPERRWIRRRRRLGYVLLVLLGIGFLWQSWAERTTKLRYPAPGEFADVGSHRLHYVVRGAKASEKDPLVVIDAGLGGASYDMADLQTQLSEFCRVVCYDRAGYGWSDRGPAPRSNHRIVTELHELLDVANLKPPYLLVGHSMGGLNMRLFASRFKDDVAGLVLVDAYSRDAFPPETDVRQVPLLFQLGNLTARFGTTRLMVPHYLPAGEDGVTPQLELARAMKSRTTFIRTYCQEDLEVDWLTSRAQMRHLNTLPVTVLLAEQHLSKWPWWGEAQRTLLSISENLDAKTIDCGHSMHVERPDAIVTAVREMLGRIAVDRP